MEEIWPGILVNGAAAIMLWGLVFRHYGERLDQLQATAERRVEREYCLLQHQGIHEAIQEIKRDQGRMMQTLEEIRMSLASENGRRRAEKELR